MAYKKDNWIICDRCGFKVRASVARETWDGLLVCPADWEARHPQDKELYLRTEKIVPNKVRTEPTDTFITTKITAEDL